MAARAKTCGAINNACWSSLLLAEQGEFISFKFNKLYSQLKLSEKFFNFDAVYSDLFEEKKASTSTPASIEHIKAQVAHVLGKRQRDLLTEDDYTELIVAKANHKMANRSKIKRLASKRSEWKGIFLLSAVRKHT